MKLKEAAEKAGVYSYNDCDRSEELLKEEIRFGPRLLHGGLAHFQTKGWVPDPKDKKKASVPNSW